MTTTDCWENMSTLLDNHSLWNQETTKEPSNHLPPHKLAPQWAQKMGFYGQMILSLFGIITNMLLVTLMFTTKLRKLTTMPYVTCLGIADGIFCLTLFLRTASSNIFYFIDTDIECQLLFYFHFSSQLWSGFLVVAISLDRFIIIRYPLKILWKTKNFIYASCIVSLLISCCLSFWGIFLEAFQTPEDIICRVQDQHKDEFVLGHYVVDLGIHVILTSLLVSLFTAIASYSLFQAKKRRKKLTVLTSVRNKQEDEVTKILLTIAVLFLILRAPHIILWCVIQILFEDNKIRLEIPKSLLAAFTIAWLIRVTNHIVNFFLYINNFNVCSRRVATPIKGSFQRKPKSGGNVENKCGNTKF